MLQLGIIDRDFPNVRKFQQELDNKRSKNPKKSAETPAGPLPVESICGATRDDGGFCDCPRRTPAPDHPKELLFPCINENNGLMQDCLIKLYKSSTFNGSPHQQLPQIYSPPVEIHLKDETEPVAINKAMSVYVHWHKKVYADLDHDEALVVIERVQFGAQMDSCQSMVVKRKHDASPRVVLDLSWLNKYCIR